MFNEILHDIHKYEENILKTRNRLIEAIWRVIVGDDKPEPEDGEMVKQLYAQTKHGPGSIYNFIYKGKTEAVLTEVQRVPREYSYFLDSDREMIGKVMENVTELAKVEKEKVGRVCAQCGKEIDPVKDGFIMCRDNFMQEKYFQEMDESDNVFCSQDCACEYLSIKRVYQTENGGLM